MNCKFIDKPAMCRGERIDVKPISDFMLSCGEDISAEHHIIVEMLEKMYHVDTYFREDKDNPYYLPNYRVQGYIFFADLPMALPKCFTDYSELEACEKDGKLCFEIVTLIINEDSIASPLPF